MNNKEFNYARKIVLTDLEKIMKKVDMLANNGKFKNVDESLDKLMEIHNKISLAKRLLEFNGLLWEENYQK